MTKEAKYPFQRSHSDLSYGVNSVTLSPIDAGLARPLGETIAQMAPWHMLGKDAASLAVSLQVEDHGDIHRVIWLNANCAGAVSIRYPWLYGPYLALLAILPDYQGRGIGSAILRWMEAEVHGTANNIWACVSSFNTDAQTFYIKHGFDTVGILPNLLRNGFSELLVRKQINERATI
jgi:ribosomal protein S18 acetylase RimI-like enzyme